MQGHLKDVADEIDVLIEINASIGEFSKGSLLLQLSGLLSVLVMRLVCRRMNVWSDAHVVGVSHDCGDMLLVPFDCPVERRRQPNSELKTLNGCLKRMEVVDDLALAADFDAKENTASCPNSMSREEILAFQWESE